MSRRSFLLSLSTTVAAACGGTSRLEATPSVIANVQQEFRPTPTLPGRPGPMRWSSRAPLPTPRSEVASAVLDGKIYVIGGFVASGQTSNVVEVYDPVADRWSRREPLPEARDHAMAAAMAEPAEHRLFVFGGARGEATKTTFGYDPAADRWRRFSDMDFRRTAGGAVPFLGGPAIMILGGTGDSPERMMLYDALKDAWRPTGSMTAPREHLAVVSTTGAGAGVYVIGGRWNGNNTGAAQVLRTNAAPWESLPSMPTPRGGTAAAAVNGRIFVAGGEAFGPTRTFAEVEVFDPGSNSWSRAPDLPTPRHGLCVQAIGDTLYVIGGGPTAGLSVSPQNEALTAF
jgi:N-acetylneuraminic acid mutarotase